MFLGEKKNKKKSFCSDCGPVSAELIWDGNYSRIMQYCNNMGISREATQRRLSRRRRGFWIAADELNAGKKEKSVHIWAGYPLTHRKKVRGWVFPLLASSAGHAREILKDTSHLEEVMPSWNWFTPDLATVSNHLLLSGSLHHKAGIWKRY